MNRATPQNRIPQKHYENRKNEGNIPLQGHYATTKKTIEENPLVATLAVFGVGLAVGSIVGSLLADGPRSSQDRPLTDRFHTRMSSILSDIIPDALEQKLRG